MSGLTGILIFFYIIVGIFFLIAWGQIFAKAGHSGWLALIFVIPIANIILFFWFAFSTWPIHRGGNIDHTLPS